LNLGSKVLAYEINAIIQNAADEGREHLNDEEAIHLLRISEKLISEYVKELENEDYGYLDNEYGYLDNEYGYLDNE
jgi:hypothetical protein